MYFSSGSPASNTTPLQSGSPLPIAFEQALNEVDSKDGFCEAVTVAARQAGCEFLFEVPGALFDHEGGRTAVIRSHTLSGRLQDSGNEILYVIFDGQDGIIRIVEEIEVSGSIQAMTHSYSRVLEIMATMSFKRGVH